MIDPISDLLIIIGMSSVGLLWVFSIVGALQTLGDTFEDHVAALIKRLKG